MAGPKKGPAERVEARNTLTAVLLADSFTQVGLSCFGHSRLQGSTRNFMQPIAAWHRHRMHSGGGGSVDPCKSMMVSSRFTLLQRFRPITIERPKVLLPLVNVPMLEYTLEWLAMNKVEEVRACGGWEPLGSSHCQRCMALAPCS